MLHSQKQIFRYPWGMSDVAQVLIIHYGSKSTPMIAQQLRQIGLQSRVSGSSTPTISTG